MNINQIMRRNIFYILFLSALPALAAMPSAGQAMPENAGIYLIKKCVDGTKVDWAEIPSSGIFKSTKADADDAKNAGTCFKAVYDDQNIYFKVYCGEPDLKNLKSETKIHDGAVWADDCVEIFITTGDGGNDYFQFISNCEGIRFEGRKAGGGNFSKDWDGEWKAVCGKETNLWTAQAVIPFKSLDAARPEAGSEWRINMCRERYCGSRAELYAWKPTIAFNDINNFGALVFEDLAAKYGKDFNKFNESVKDRRNKIAARLEKGKDNYYANKFRELEKKYALAEEAARKSPLPLEEYINVKSYLDVLPAEYASLAAEIEIEELFK